MSTDSPASDIAIWIDGRSVVVPVGTTVAAALALAGRAAPRRSVGGQRRAPLCGMGVCFECRATVDGQPHVRTCQTLCQPGMEVVTDA